MSYINIWDKVWISCRGPSPLQPLRFEGYEGFTQDLVSRLDVKVAIEAGCGTGSTSIPFTRCGVTVVLLDVSLPALILAKHLFCNLGSLAKVDFVRGDIFSMPFRDACVDLALNGGLLEHFSPSDSTAILREMGRVAGNVMTLVPYRVNFCYWVAKLICKLFKRGWFWGGELERDYTERELHSEFQQAGIRQIVAAKFGYSLGLSQLIATISKRVDDALRAKLTGRLDLRTLYGEASGMMRIMYQALKALAVVSRSRDYLAMAGISAKAETGECKHPSQSCVVSDQTLVRALHVAFI